VDEIADRILELDRRPSASCFRCGGRERAGGAAKKVPRGGKGSIESESVLRLTEQLKTRLFDCGRRFQSLVSADKCLSFDTGIAAGH